MKWVTLLAWESCRRGALWCAVALLSMCALATIVYGSLLRAGPLDPTAGRSLHFVFLWTQFVCFGGAAYAAQGRLARLYLSPLSTKTLVTWTSLVGTTLAATMYLAAGAFVNWQFQVDWPLWGPALFFAAALFVMQSVLWTTKGWGIVQAAACALAAALLEWWLQTLYGGGPFLRSDRMWRDVTPGEFSSLCGMIAVAWCAAVIAIARDRRGDCAERMTPQAWLARRIARMWPAPRRPAPFRSAAAAQFWFEWRQKGLLLPATLTAGLVFLIFGYVSNLFEDGDYELLHLSIGFGMGLAPVAAIVGLIIGHLGPDRGQMECGSFLATRPMSSAGLAAALLKVAGASLLLTWGMWSLALAGSTARLYAVQRSAPALDLWTHHGELTALVDRLGIGWGPAAVVFAAVVAWAPLALAVSLTLTGRQSLVISVFLGALTLFLGLLFANEMVPAASAATLRRAEMALIGTVGFAGTVAAYVLVLRRRLVSSGTLIPVVAGWLTLCFGCGLLHFLQGAIFGFSLVFTAGLLAVPLAPLAAAPLALNWNRHR